MPTDPIVTAFAATARPVILRYFNRGSCIASSRIAIEVLRHFGIPARALPVRFVLRVPALETAFVTGLSDQEKTKARREAGSFVTVKSGPAIKGGSEIGWNGHLIVHAAGVLIDPSFDQALDAIAQQGHRIDATPLIGVFPAEVLPDEFRVELAAVLDDETRILVEYVRIADESFQLAPAWETDHLEPAIAQIIGRMEKLLERAA